MEDVTGGVKKKKISRKILRYFPLIPRQQRLYMNDTTSAYVHWHTKELIKEGKVRHQANFLAWKHVDGMVGSSGMGQNRPKRFSDCVARANAKPKKIPNLFSTENLSPYLSHRYFRT